MTNYTRQIKSARVQIVRKGTTLSWFKPGDADSSDTTPEFPDIGPGTWYPGIPVVYIPAVKTADYTSILLPEFDVAGDFMLAIIPGDVPFTPEHNDSIMRDGGDIKRVDAINRIAPDDTPIIFELRLR